MDKPILDTGSRRTFEGSNAVRDISEGKGRYDLLPFEVIDILAKHYEKGALKYDERNWERGIPTHSFLDSALRHLSKFAMGYQDEDHLIACIWNCCGLYWTMLKKPQFNNIPAWKGAEGFFNGGAEIIPPTPAEAKIVSSVERLEKEKEGIMQQLEETRQELAELKFKNAVTKAFGGKK